MPPYTFDLMSFDRYRAKLNAISARHDEASTAALDRLELLQQNLVQTLLNAIEDKQVTDFVKELMTDRARMQSEAARQNSELKDLIRESNSSSDTTHNQVQQEACERTIAAVFDQASSVRNQVDASCAGITTRIDARNSEISNIFRKREIELKDLIEQVTIDAMSMSIQLEELSTKSNPVVVCNLPTSINHRSYMPSNVQKNLVPPAIRPKPFSPAYDAPPYKSEKFHGKIRLPDMSKGQVHMAAEILDLCRMGAFQSNNEEITTKSSNLAIVFVGKPTQSAIECEIKEANVHRTQCTEESSQSFVQPAHVVTSGSEQTLISKLGVDPTEDILGTGLCAWRERLSRSYFRHLLLQLESSSSDLAKTFFVCWIVATFLFSAPLEEPTKTLRENLDGFVTLHFTCDPRWFNECPGSCCWTLREAGNNAT